MRATAPKVPHTRLFVDLHCCYRIVTQYPTILGSADLATLIHTRSLKRVHLKRYRVLFRRGLVYESMSKNLLHHQTCCVLFDFVPLIWDKLFKLPNVEIVLF